MKIKKSLVILSFLFVAVFLVASVQAQTTVDYYYGLTCSHCKVVADSGVLDRLNETGKVTLTKYEVWYNAENQNKFNDVVKFLGAKKSEMGVPFLVINCSGKYTYLVGDSPIIQNVEDYALNCNFTPVTPNTIENSNYALWISIIVIIIMAIYFGYFRLRKK